MPNAKECRAFAKEYKDRARAPGVSKDIAFLMNNIARSFMGLATQLDMLAAKMRDTELENRLLLNSPGLQPPK
jgi:hypothetical protein